MKKIISLFLATLMILSAFSCLTVVSFAATTDSADSSVRDAQRSATYNQNPYESIYFFPVSNLEFDQYTCGSWELQYNFETGKDENCYIYYSDFLWETGNVILLIRKDGQEEVYTCYDWNYMDENGNYLFVDFIYDSSAWDIGNDNIITVEAEGISCDVNVTIRENDSIIYDDIFVAEKVSANTCYITVVKTIESFNGALDVPEKIDGYSVVGIEDGVLGNVQGLKTLNLPSTFNAISENLFNGCYELKTINVATANKKFASVNGVIYNKALTEILYCPEAFTGKLVIKAGVTKIPNDVLSKMGKASSVTVEEGNKVFAVAEGVLYNKSYTKIFKAFSIGANYVMRPTVTELANYSFSGVNTVKSVKFSDKVTKISYGAFADCTSLSSVTLPKKLETIGGWAFSDTKLSKVTLPDTTKVVGANAFFCTESLSEIVLNEGLETIGSRAFYYCGLKKIALPDSLTTMGSGCFSSNYSLYNVSIGSGLKSIPKSTFYECSALESVSIPKNIVKLYPGSFALTGLKSISLHNKITSIDGSFYGCHNLTKVYVPDSVVSMNDAFSWCERLTYAYVGKGVKSMNYAFSGCENLERVDLAEGISGSADSAFSDCPKLKDVDLPSTVTEISYGQFWGCEKVDAIDIPSNLYKIESAAFEDSGWLNNKSNGRVYLEHVFYTFKGKMPAKYTLELKKGTKSIADSALENQKNLVGVKLPYGLKYIGAYAFDGCTNLKSVTIPASVTYIGEYSLGYSYHMGYDIEKHENFTIYGTENSAAQKYAKANGFTFKLVGKHSSSDWIVVKKATANAAGSQHKECMVCGKVLQTKTIPQLKPATPKLSAIANTVSGVKVAWGKVSGADSYIVYRSVYNAKTKSWSDWSRIASGVKSTSYTDKTVKSGTFYKYTVKGNNEVGYGGHDTKGIKICFLSAPKLSAIANTASGVKFAWGKVSGAKDYTVYRRTYNAKTKKWGGWTLLKDDVTGVSYVDKTAKSGVYYMYTVRANNSSARSSYTSGLKTYFLTAPKLSKVSSAKSGVTFSWGKVTGANGYIVYRKTGNGSYQKLATVKGNTKVSYLDKTAKKGKTYSYTVKAYYGDYRSAHNTKGLAVKDKY